VRNSSTRILTPYESAYPAVLTAIHTVGIDVPVAGNPIVGETKRSVRKNRWAAAVTASIRPEAPSTTVVDWSIDMLGDKHGEVLAEIHDAITVPIDDLGVAEALDRLGKMGRFFGRREALALTNYVHLDERVVELAQGVYDKHQGMLVLTTRRLFFFDKTLMSAKVEEFDLNAIGALAFSKKLGGESIDIAISGRSATISQVAHGRAETLIAAFRQVRSGARAPGPAPHATSAPDLADQIRKLSELHHAGILTSEEFNSKKADLLSRM
jgi:hypothetical protein